MRWVRPRSPRFPRYHEWATSFERCSWTEASGEAREAGFVPRLDLRELLAYSVGADQGRSAAQRGTCTH